MTALNFVEHRLTVWVLIFREEKLDLQMIAPSQGKNSWMVHMQFQVVV